MFSFWGVAPCPSLCQTWHPDKQIKTFGMYSFNKTLPSTNRRAKNVSSLRPIAENPPSCCNPPLRYFCHGNALTYNVLCSLVTKHHQTTSTMETWKWGNLNCVFPGHGSRINYLLIPLNWLREGWREEGFITSPDLINTWRTSSYLPLIGDFMAASTIPTRSWRLLGSWASPDAKAARASAWRPRYWRATPCRKYA